MGPPPPRHLPMPVVDPSLMPNMGNSVPNNRFSAADTLTDDSAKDSRGASSPWLAFAANSSHDNSNPITRFYNEDEPWNSERVTGVKRQRLHGPFSYPTGTRSDYGVYPNGYPSSDSGYSSMNIPAKSVASLAENSEAIPNRSAAMETMVQMSSSLDPIYSTGVQQMYETQPTGEDPQQLESSQGLQCERDDCEFIAKCQSEMK
jgi:hypothetical protein